MCAIAGEINFTAKASLLKTRKMLRSMKHRGPDGSNTYLHENLGFGMNRLAIVDLAGGDQPLYNEDKSLVIVGNGEIYNYPEIQKSLVMKKHVLSSGSDIETPLHLYEQYGEDFVYHLQGMFSLALYDKKKNILMLVRDRLGEKPLYYSKADGGLYFASELKALLSIKEISRDLNKNALAKYFIYSYIPEPETAFINIKRLPPGHMMKVDIGKGKTEIINYWKPAKIKSIPIENLDQKIHKEIKHACKLNSRADVEVGISLSGGIDSATVLTFSAKEKNNKATKAFSVGYEATPKTDERRLAKKTADHYGLEFKETEIKASEFVNDFPKLIYSLDEPVADLAAYSIYRVAKLARENNIKVLLGGLGGDELFWGYSWVTQALKEYLAAPTKHFNLYQHSNLYKKGKQFTTKLLTKEYRNFANNDERTSKKILNPLSLGRKALEELREIWLVGNCLTLSDRLGMANSVEMRSPLVDYKLFELALKSKRNILSFDKGQKYWMRKAIKKEISPEVFNQPKRGFTPPVASWLNGLFSQYMYLLDKGFLVKKGIVSPIAAKIITKIWVFLPMYWEQLYQLLVLEVWFRTYVWKEKIAL